MTGSPDIASLGTILSVWAHPDDETYLAGGIMAAARDAGQRVVCQSASAGELGTSDPDTWPPERLGAVRRLEAAAAMAVLGVAEHGIRGLPDGGLAACEVEGRRWVSELFETVRPDTIMTFGADGMTFHPDHQTVHRWVTDTWAERGGEERLLYATTTVERIAEYRALYEEWGVYMSDERPTGVATADLDLHVHLDGAALDRKLTALRAMATQTTGSYELLGPERFADQAADECFVVASARLVARS